MQNDDDQINATVTGVYPNKITIEVCDLRDFALAEDHLFVGSYLRISDVKDCGIIAVIQSFSIIHNDNKNVSRRHLLEAVPIGFIDSDGKFSRGGNNIAIPPTGVTIASADDIRSIYEKVDLNKSFSFSCLAQDKGVQVVLDGDKFFSKHIAIVGSTGCGKSSSVATILRKGTEAKNDGYSGLNNSHIVIFDLHGEYKAAFSDENHLNINNLLLPYWLMNGEELEELLIETGENQAYNQANLLRRIVTKNKQVHSKNDNVMFDSPVEFSIVEVLNCLINLSREMRSADNPDTAMIKGAQTKFQSDDDKFEHYFINLYEFDDKASKINKGSYNDGTLEKFISRIRWKLSDKRLEFLLGQDASKQTFENTLRQIIGYNNSEKANITIIDLSGIPFEVLSITVSLLSRILFEYGYYYKKSMSEDAPKTPILLVYEEAHKYIPKSAGAKYNASRSSIERIAKEGRKYGVTLALVTQRPSEISETIFSQCNNFVAMRLTNPDDQNYVKRLLPDSLEPLTDTLPTLEAGSAILLGDSVILPALVNIDRTTPEPSSSDVEYLQEWKKEWHEVEFQRVIVEWRK